MSPTTTDMLRDRSRTSEQVDKPDTSPQLVRRRRHACDGMTNAAAAFILDSSIHAKKITCGLLEIMNSSTQRLTSSLLSQEVRTSCSRSSWCTSEVLRAISQWDGSLLIVTFDGLEMGELGRTSTHRVESRGYHSLLKRMLYPAISHVTVPTSQTAKTTNLLSLSIGIYVL